MKLQQSKDEQLASHAVFVANTVSNKNKTYTFRIFFFERALLNSNISWLSLQRDVHLFVRKQEKTKDNLKQVMIAIVCSTTSDQLII